MKRFATTKSTATLSAAAFVLALGVPTVDAAGSGTAKLDQSKQNHGYSSRGYGDRSSHGGYRDNGDQHGSRNGHHASQPSHSSRPPRHYPSRDHGYRPSYPSHRPPTYGGHGGYGGHDGHGSYGPYRTYGHIPQPRHHGYYCSRCQFRTASYSLFYNHVHHLHHVPWYDIAALIEFDPVKLFFTFGGHGPVHAGHH